MRRAHGVLLTIVAVACVAAGIAAAQLWPPDQSPQATTIEQDVMLRDAVVTAIEAAPEVDTTGLAPGATPLLLTARFTNGREVSFDMVDETGDTFAVGQQVRVAEATTPEGDSTYYINDIKRERPLLILGAVFLLAVLAFGRWQGARALLGLGITLAVVALFVVPAVLAGRDPILVALSAAVAIMVVTLYLTHGVNPKTTAAVVGTLSALALTVGLSALFIRVASLTGLSSEEARMASIQVGGLSLRGLLLAGIIIGALGVLDDVTMAQSSTVFELRRADRAAGFGQLFASGMTVGRDHVAATINTLFLAYAGASLPLLILFSSSPDPLGVIASSEIVAVEIVRTLVGSIGLMASVPVTTALAAWLTRARVASPATVVVDDEPRRPRRRRRDIAAEPAAFGDTAPFSPDDEADLEWERRLRASYGLDRRRR